MNKLGKVSVYNRDYFINVDYIPYLCDVNGNLVNINNVSFSIFPFYSSDYSVYPRISCAANSLCYYYHRSGSLGSVVKFNDVNFYKEYSFLSSSNLLFCLVVCSLFLVFFKSVFKR